MDAAVILFFQDIIYLLLPIQLTGKSRPTTDDMRPSFKRLLAKRKLTSNQIINCTSSHMLPKLTDYIEEGKTIDAVIFEPAVLLINELFES